MTVFQTLFTAALSLAPGIFLLGLIGITWHSYTQLLRDKACLRELNPGERPTLDTWPHLPLVSVLVAAWNEEENIIRHIRSFRDLKYPCKEMILCAGGSDQTFPIASTFAEDDVIVLEQRAGEGKQRALRRGLQLARGSVIYLTDADCILDDDSFERTIYPIVWEGERACTGSSRPYTEIQTIPFVVAQSASVIYRSQHWPDYAPGLLGRNCAVDRELLDACRGLDMPAPTGTDYVLAKMISRLGIRIRQIPESRIATEYPTSIAGYIRQQRRWLRNVALHGWRFGAKDEVRASLFTSLLGFGMLVLPLSTAILGKIGLVAWILLLIFGLSSRLRYLTFASGITGIPLSWRLVAIQIPMMFLDFVAWSRPLLDYFRSDSEKIW